MKKIILLLLGMCMLGCNKKIEQVESATNCDTLRTVLENGSDRTYLYEVRTAKSLIPLDTLKKYQQLEMLYSSASRSVEAYIINDTPDTLKYLRQGLLHGIMPHTPIAVILPHSHNSGAFLAESSGAATGVEGQVIYTWSNGDWLYLNFNNPYIGSNTYSAHTSLPNIVTWGGGGGDNAVVTYHIRR